MTSNASEFVGDIPRHYDTGLGPNIFFDYADLIAAHAARLPNGKVVELAAGTGIVSQRLRDVLPATSRLTVTDLNAPMLEIAKTRLDGAQNVTCSVANAMELPFADNSFDLMVAQFGVMFFPDKPASYREAARVIRPGGHYVFNVWGPLETNPFADILNALLEELYPNDPPGFYKVPFHYGDPNQVLGDLTAAGLDQVTHETISITKEMVAPERFAHALVHGNPLADEIESRGEAVPRDLVTTILERFSARFGPEPLTMPLQATTFQVRIP